MKLSSLLTLCLVAASGLSAEYPSAVHVEHAPSFSGGRLEGGLRVNRPESVTLNSGTRIEGRLCLPGQPEILRQGGVIGSVNLASGIDDVSGHRISAGEGSFIEEILQCVEALPLPELTERRPCTGTRRVTLGRHWWWRDQPGDWETVCDATFNRNYGSIAVPVGSYGRFVLNSDCEIILGEAGSSEPLRYGFRELIINAGARVRLIGPVVLCIGSDLVLNGDLGDEIRPDWLHLEVEGNVTLNSPSKLCGAVLAPKGRVTVNTGCLIKGFVAAKRFTLNRDGIVKLFPACLPKPEPNRRPTADSFHVETPFETPVEIVLSGRDPDGDELTFAVVSQPSSGSLSGSAPDVLWTPDPGFYGEAEISYVASDGRKSSLPAKVTVTVAPPPADGCGSRFDESAVAIVSHAPVINAAEVYGSVQMLLPEDLRVNGRAAIRGDLLVPGSPRVQLKGMRIDWDGILEGQGSAEPSNYCITLNGGVSIGHVRTRTDAVELEAVEAPEPPSGHRTVWINHRWQDPGDFTTLRHLTLNAFCGSIEVPPGAYGHFSANAFSEFVLGTPGSTEPEVYSFECLTLNAHAALRVVGPVIVRLDKSLILNCSAGTDTSIDWLRIELATGDVTLNGHSSLKGLVYAPQGKVTLNGNSELTGRIQSSQLTVNGTARLTLGGSWPDNDGGSSLPIAFDQRVTVLEDRSTDVVLNGEPGACSVDSPLEYAVLTLPAHGTLSGIPPDLTYSPNENYFGPDSFTFAAVDNAGPSTPATVEVTVQPVNDAPVAISQSVTLAEDTQAEVLLFASDVENDPVTFRVMRLPINGVLVTATGSPVTPASVIADAELPLVFTPTPDFYGSDAFVVVASDGLDDSHSVIVNLAVSPVNDLPFGSIEPLDLTEDQPAVTIPLRDRFSDIEDGSAGLSYLLSDPGDGTVVSVSLQGPDLVVTPVANAFGDTVVSLNVTDFDGGQLQVQVPIAVASVNDLPVPLPRQFTVQEDEILGGNLEAYDVETGALAFSVKSEPANGTLTLNADGSFNYTPNPDFFGDESFVALVTDGEATVELPVGVFVDPVNDKPLAFDVDRETPEDTPVEIRFSVADVDEDFLQVLAISEPLHGSLTDVEVLLDDPESGVFDFAAIYTPDSDFNGIDSFSYISEDGVLQSDPATFTITVGPVNDLPSLPETIIETDEDAPIVVTLEAFDVDGDSVTLSLISVPEIGELASLDGTPLVTDNSYENPLALRFHPVKDAFGQDSFILRLFDGTEFVESAVQINVYPVNDAPVALDDALTTRQGVSVSIELLELANDVDSEILTFALAEAPANGSVTVSESGRVLFVPDADFSGIDAFRYSVSDGNLSAEATMSVTVIGANRAPVVTNRAITTNEDTPVAFGIGEAIADPDGDPLIHAVEQLPLSGVLSKADGSELSQTPHVISASDLPLTWNPETHSTESVRMLVSVTDGEFTEIQQITINVLPVNDAPNAFGSTLSLDENTTGMPTFGGEDVDSDNLSVVIQSFPQNGVLLHGDDLVETGNHYSLDGFTYRPNRDFNGGDEVVFKISDGDLLSEFESVIVDVLPVNSRPIASNSSVTTQEATPIAITLEGSDPDGDTVRYQLTSFPSSGLIALGNGISVQQVPFGLSASQLPIIYTPAPGFTGSDAFTFVASDGVLESTQAEIAIAVTPINNPPVALAQEFSVPHNGSQGFTPQGTDSEGDSLSYRVLSLPETGTLYFESFAGGIFEIESAPFSIPSDPGQLIFQTADGQTGFDAITFSVFDGEFYSEPADIRFAVTDADGNPAMNRAPFAYLPGVGEWVLWANGNAFRIKDVSQTSDGGLILVADNLATSSSPLAIYSGSSTSQQSVFERSENGAFVMKLSGSGAVEWIVETTKVAQTVSYSSTWPIQLTKVVEDPNGGFVVAGDRDAFGQTYVFGGSAIPGYSRDNFVAKISDDGVVEWISNIQSSDVGDFQITDIDVSLSGDIAVAGETRSTAEVYEYWDLSVSDAYPFEDALLGNLYSYGFDNETLLGSVRSGKGFELFAIEYERRRVFYEWLSENGYNPDDFYGKDIYEVVEQLDYYDVLYDNYGYTDVYEADEYELAEVLWEIVDGYGYFPSYDDYFDVSDYYYDYGYSPFSLFGDSYGLAEFVDYYGFPHFDLIDPVASLEGDYSGPEDLADVRESIMVSAYESSYSDYESYEDSDGDGSFSIGNDEQIEIDVFYELDGTYTDPNDGTLYSNLQIRYQIEIDGYGNVDLRIGQDAYQDAYAGYSVRVSTMVTGEPLGTSNQRAIFNESEVFEFDSFDFAESDSREKAVIAYLSSDGTKQWDTLISGYDDMWAYVPAMEHFSEAQDYFDSNNPSVYDPARSNQTVGSIRFRPDGGLWVAGGFSGPTKFGDEFVFGSPGYSFENADTYIAGFTAEGDYEWVWQTVWDNEITTSGNFGQRYPGDSQLSEDGQLYILVNFRDTGLIADQSIDFSHTDFSAFGSRFTNSVSDEAIADLFWTNAAEIGNQPGGSAVSGAGFALLSIDEFGNVAVERVVSIDDSTGILTAKGLSLDGETITISGYLNREVDFGDDAIATAIDIDLFEVTYAPNGEASVETLPALQGLSHYSFEPRDGFYTSFNGNESFNAGAFNQPVSVGGVDISPVGTFSYYLVNRGSVSAYQVTPAGLSITLLAEDLDADPLDFSMFDGPLHGSLSPAVSPVAGLQGATPADYFVDVFYTPAPGYFGEDEFWFKVDDGLEDSNSVRVPLFVLPDPGSLVAENMELSVEEDSPSTTFELSAIAGSEPTTPLVFSLLEPAGNPAFGSVSLDGQTVTFTPAHDYDGSSGPFFFSFLVEGDFNGVPLSDTGAVSINIIPVNDAPVVLDSTLTVPEDVIFEFTPEAFDVDSTFAITILSGPNNGSIDRVSATAFRYQSNVDFNGIDQLTFRATDEQGAASQVGTLDITVAAVNDRPFLSDLAVTTSEDTAVEIHAPGQPGAFTLSSSDIESTVAELRYSVRFVTRSAQIFRRDGSSVSSDDLLDPSVDFPISYRPPQDRNGVDDFEMRAVDPDGGISEPATITITIHPVNDIPVGYDDEFVANEDTAANIRLRGWDLEDGAVSGFLIVSQPNGTRISELIVGFMRAVRR